MKHYLFKWVYWKSEYSTLYRKTNSRLIYKQRKRGRWKDRKREKKKKKNRRTGRNKNERLVVNKQLALWIFNKLVVCVGYRLALFQYYTILISDVETVYFCKWLDCYRDPYRVKKHCRWLLITEMFTGSKWSDPHCSLVSSYLRALQNLIHTAANVTICLPGVTVSISLWFLKHFKRCLFFFEVS